MTVHTYDAAVSWSGSTGGGYRDYSRNHSGAAGAARIGVHLSADAAFRGDPRRLNPEQLLVMAAASCQLLSFLSLAARSGVEVLDYRDDAHGTMTVRSDGVPTHVERIVLRPVITVAEGTDQAAVRALAAAAHAACYVANSLRGTVSLDLEVRSR